MSRLPLLKAERLARSKHLTDTELAAEYHAADAAYLQEALDFNETKDGFRRVMQENAKARILLRFATTPHFTEEP